MERNISAKINIQKLSKALRIFKVSIFLSVEILFFVLILNLGETIKCFLNRKNIFLFRPLGLQLLSDTEYKITMEPEDTATAKSLQSCPTLCDPIDGNPPGSPVPGILQARLLEWGAIAFSNISMTIQKTALNLSFL